MYIMTSEQIVLKYRITIGNKITYVKKYYRRRKKYFQ